MPTYIPRAKIACLRYTSPNENSDKIWQAAIVEREDGNYSFGKSWGRYGTKLAGGQSSLYTTQAGAVAHFTDQVINKALKGYKLVNWQDVPNAVTALIAQLVNLYPFRLNVVKGKLKGKSGLSMGEWNIWRLPEPEDEIPETPIPFDKKSSAAYAEKVLKTQEHQADLLDEILAAGVHTEAGGILFSTLETSIKQNPDETEEFIKDNLNILKAEILKLKNDLMEDIPLKGANIHHDKLEIRRMLKHKKLDLQQVQEWYLARAITIGIHTERGRDHLYQCWRHVLDSREKTSPLVLQKCIELFDLVEEYDGMVPNIGFELLRESLVEFREIKNTPRTRFNLIDLD